MVKNPLANAGDAGSTPGLERCPLDIKLKKRQLAEDYVCYESAAAAKSLQSCPTLCDPIDSSPPGSPIPGILQARTLEWVA